MLQKGFFNVDPFNPNPYWDNTIVNLSGASKFEQNIVFVPGRYRIELAPGKSRQFVGTEPEKTQTYVSNMDYIENITEPFIVRAYCGSNATNKSVGTNPYVGEFKVNGVNGPSHAAPIDVNHIFGAGGGNGNNYGVYLGNARVSGGANCLGNGAVEPNEIFGTSYYGAGSCLHLLPVGGVFGTDYIRAYHAAPLSGAPGSAYGGAAGVKYFTSQGGGSSWGTRGGNSPYGSGGPTGDTSSLMPDPTPGTGIGAGGKIISGVVVGAGAYFNGTIWIDAPGNTTNTGSSYIRVTYLGPLR